MLTRIVRTGLARTVSTPAMPAAWTMCVTPRVASVEARQVEHVALHEAEVRMLAEVGARERVAVEVVERDHLVRVDEPAGERRPDEAGAAGDQDPLAAQRHAASLAAYLDRTLHRSASSSLSSWPCSRPLVAATAQAPRRDRPADRLPRDRRPRRRRS